LTINGTVSGAGTLTSGASNATLVLGGSAGSMGTINLTSGAQTFAGFTMNVTGTSPNVNINGNLTTGALTLTSGLVNMGNNIAIYTGAATPMLASSATSYFSFIGTNSGFQWNMPASQAAGTYKWPVGPAGTVTGFRPVILTTTGANPATIVPVKIGFVNEWDGAYNDLFRL